MYKMTKKICKRCIQKQVNIKIVQTKNKNI